MKDMRATAKVVLSINTGWNIFNFRKSLVEALTMRGFEVLALAPDDGYASRIREMGCRFIPVAMDNNGTNPRRDCALFLQYLRILRRERPMAFLGYTVKPNVYGSLAAHTLGIPVINNIAGLGTVFVHRGPLTKLVILLYRLALARSARVFFQNAEDMELFVSQGVVPGRLARRIAGSGIDLAHYAVAPPPDGAQGRDFHFLYVGRILRDKGIPELVAAARTVRARCPHARIDLLGFIDEHNANCIRADAIRRWEAEGLIRYLGQTDDVRPNIATCDCVVLPSYREGLPRSLLEAAAMGRPIIATDVAGCRDVVQDELNGFLCKAADPGDLARQMLRMMELPAALRGEMGVAGRARVAREFDQAIALRSVLNEIDVIAGAERTGPSGLANQAVSGRRVGHE